MSEIQINTDETTEGTVQVTVAGVLESVLPELPDQQYTPYQIATVLNLILANLEANGLYDGGAVRPQMVYNYSTNGMIVKGSKKHNEHRYTADEVREFIHRFVSRKTSEVTGTTTSDLATQISQALNK